MTQTRLHPLGRTLVLGLVVSLGLAQGYAQTPELVGSWHGTSLCVDKVKYPACHDEEVIYDAVQKGRTDTVTVRADKVVNGTREFMGAFDFIQARDSTWVGDFQNSRVHVRISWRVRANHLSGYLSDEPSGQRVREINADRVP